jgi:hypothetical protein
MARKNQVTEQLQEDIMRALHTTLALETGTAWTPAMTVKTRRPATVRAEPAATWLLLRNMVLFLMAPFVGLVYAVLLPFIGLGMLLWMGARTFVETGRLATTLRVGRKVVLIAAAPFAGLAYLIAMPFIGLGMLAWVGATAMIAAPAR